MSHRREQLASALRKTVGELIAQGLNDPRVRGLVSVTGVEVSPDDNHAEVRISVLPAAAEALTLQGLESAAGRLRISVGKKLRMRSVPHLRFVADHSLKKQAEVLDAIRKVVPQEPPAANQEGDAP